MNTYEKLIEEREQMKKVVEGGRKGTSYHNQALERLKTVREKIKQVVKERQSQ
jgi:exonuclease VII small subunit